MTVFPLQDFLRAILDQLFIAFDGYGDEDFGFGFGGGDVEGYVVKVGDDLVDGYRGCAGIEGSLVRFAGERRARGRGGSTRRSVL